jgi:Lrp/AsnC family leucine-responsive transcriptional regulator
MSVFVFERIIASYWPRLTARFVLHMLIFSLFLLKMPELCMTKLDRADIALLETVQRNNRLTSEELAEIVNLSPTACQRRLKRLRAEGVIESDVAIVSPKAAGRPVSMVVMVSLERERADIIDRFKSSVRSSREVMLGYYVTGEADFVLVVTAQDMEGYEAFTRRFFYENPDIKGFKTMVVMDRVKASFAFPIEVSDED